MPTYSSTLKRNRTPEERHLLKCEEHRVFCGKPFVNTAVIELTATAIQSDNKVLVGAKGNSVSKGNSVLSQRADPQCRSALRLWATTLHTQHVQEPRHGERDVEDKHEPEMRGCMVTKGCVVAWLQSVAWLHGYKGLRACMLTKGCVVACLQRGDGRCVRCRTQHKCHIQR